MMVTVPPIRRYFGDYDREKIPLTYPSGLYFSPIHNPQSLIVIQYRQAQERYPRDMMIEGGDVRSVEKRCKNRGVYGAGMVRTLYSMHIDWKLRRGSVRATNRESSGLMQ